MPSIGWMIIANGKDGTMKAMPASPQTLDMLPNFLHGTLPTFGGVWNTEQEAEDVRVMIPGELCDLFEVVPVSVTILKRGL